MHRLKLERGGGRRGRGAPPAAAQAASVAPLLSSAPLGLLLGGFPAFSCVPPFTALTCRPARVPPLPTPPRPPAPPALSQGYCAMAADVRHAVPLRIGTVGGVRRWAATPPPPPRGSEGGVPRSAGPLRGTFAASGHTSRSFCTPSLQGAASERRATRRLPPWRTAAAASSPRGRRPRFGGALAPPWPTPSAQSASRRGPLRARCCAPHSSPRRCSARVCWMGSGPPPPCTSVFKPPPAAAPCCAGPGLALSAAAHA